MNIVGGISVPEGARIYVDNIAMTRNVCEEVSDADKWVYLQTFEQVDVPDVRSSTLSFSVGWRARTKPADLERSLQTVVTRGDVGKPHGCRQALK